MKFISPLFGFALLLSAAISAQGAAPTVFIRCPTNGAVFTAAPNLTLIAQAADPDVGGSVTRVDFYRGNTLIGQSTNGGFSLVWSNVAAGAYALTAVATDNTGLSATSAVVNLSINPLGANQINLLAAGSIWKYLDNGSDQGTGWVAPAFVDTSWNSGPAQLGYGDGDEATQVSFGGNGANKFITTYFRRTFNVANVSTVTNLLVNILRDDGAIVYLNGTELFRDNMPLGPVNFATLATVAIGNSEESVTFIATNFTSAPLVNGVNTLAVEIHQSAPTSSDISFEMELIAETGAPPPNQPPTVSITSPTNTSAFAANSTITIDATAGDSDGSVTNVEFFRGSTKLGEDSTNPYSFVWSNVPAGSYQLTARARDNGGLISTSAVVNISVVNNQAPTVSITSPTNGSSFTAPTNIALVSSPADADGNLAKVEFFENGAKIGERASAPFSFTRTNTPAGSFVFTAVASDTLNVRGTSAPVNVNVTGGNTPPTVAITNPVNNATFNAPASVVIGASASDPGGSVARVEFYWNGAKLGEDTTSPYSITSNNVPIGNYQLTAVAIDNLGLSATSSVVIISVINGGGPVSPTLIATGSVWKYLDNGSDEGTAWRALAFNDSTWASGPGQLGYGDGDEATVVAFGPDQANKYITTYFRRQITVNNPAAYVSLGIRMLRDDGAVVYLNGTEIFRSNIGAGPVDYQTLAGNAGDDGNVFQTTNGIPANLLVPGNNIVAVEVHQTLPTSTDITFDLELNGNTNNAPPTVTINSPANNTTFTAPANITIGAGASDPDGNVSKVEFFQGGNKIGESFTIPFGFTWTSVPVGNYSLTAVASDTQGARGTSGPVNIFVTASTAPTVTSVVPPAGAVSSLSQITVNFSQPVTGVDAADLLVNGVAATSVSGSAASYTFTFPQPQEGTVSISWATQHGILSGQVPPQPFDASDVVSTWQYNFVDTVRPVVATISPVAGANVKSLSELTLTFSEAVQGVRAADLLINGTPCNSVKGVGAGDYSFEFDQPSNGLVRITWSSNVTVRDFSAAQNRLVTNTWSYVLNTNAIEDAVVINEIMYHPSSHKASETYIELFNKGSNAVNLTGWRITSGASFNFSNVTMAAGAYLVIAADVAGFTAKYPAVSNYVGPWVGSLSHSGEKITLKNALGDTVQSIDYADEGDWALRRRSALWPQGWDWVANHDGLGSSLELINPNLRNNQGQNWTASSTVNGTPGRVNSVSSANVAPLIANVAHFPAVPRPTNSVRITTEVIDESTNGVTVNLFYRLGSNPFTSVPMLDNGANGDGLANDGVYGATIPAQTNLAVVEFYVRAVDSSSNARTWPGPTDGSGTQGANALYQVDNEIYTGPQPIYRVIMTDAERDLLDNINATNPGRDDQMNATFITMNGADTKVRYRVGIRLRGAGSRGVVPPNFQMHTPTDSRWNGVKEINLNTQYTYSQVIGSTLARKMGLPSEEAIPVQMRVNGQNRANSGSPQFGSYVHLEVLDADYAENHFPNDPNGNVYRCSRPGGDLSYRGTDPNSYSSQGYSKESNASENDWTDLFNLTAVLSNTPDPDFANAVRQVADVQEWARYFAVLASLGYGETAIGSDGAPDDFSMYRGLNDPRFLIFAHDHDTDLGEGQSPVPTTANLFRATANPVVNRFLKHPEFAPLYYKELKRISDTVMRPEVVNPLIENLIGDWAGGRVASMENYAAQRRNYIISQIPLNLTVVNTLPQANGYYTSATATLSLSGSANVIETRYIKVNNSFASWSGWQGTWTISGVPLQRGVNRIVVQELDADFNEIERVTQDVLYDQPATSVSGAVSGSVIWTASGGPYLVTANITVGAGATLTIQPGTTVYFAPGTTMTVSSTGRLLAEGTDNLHIRLTRQLGAANWGSLDFIGASLESRLVYVDFEACGGTTIGGHNAQVHANNSIVFFDHLTFPSTPVVEYISFDASSFIVQNSIFPTYPPPNGPEMLHGVNGIPASGYGIFRDNYFGHTYGFNDTIDFTGGQRPGAILQVINNIFDGATDDHLDLDSTDAWIEGNIFLHAHRDPTRTDDPRDTASAISGGVDVANQFSEWTVINNLFYDVDHAILNKGGAGTGAGRFIFLNNTLVHVAKEWGAGPTNDIAAFNFSDDGVPLPPATYGAGAYIAGNIIWDAPALTANYNSNNLTVIFDNNIVPTPWTGPGTNNLVIDPLLHLELINNVTNADWKTVKAALTPHLGSPALASGIGGFDRGGLNPRGVLVYGEPPSVTQSNSATLTVAPGGTFNWGSVVPPYLWGYTHYKWKLDNGAWSAETAITTSPTISLTGLSSGSHTVYVTGKNDAGYYQDDPFVYPVGGGQPAHVTTSRTWVVNPRLSPIRINEVLARNSTAVPIGSKFPDLIEFYNSGNTPVLLDGMGLTDERRDPFKFVFPAGTSIPARGYLVVYADSDTTPSGVHTGFQLDGDGDELYLYTSAGEVVDSIRFGMQIPDFSIGRLADGSWHLTRPTLGLANVIQPTGDETRLRINEWLADARFVYANDFIELYNPVAVPVDLSGLYLTDNPIGAPDQSRIPALSFIPANGFAVFLADGDTDQGANHVNFKLAPEKGMIGLVSAELEVIDCIVYGSQSTDVSEGRSPNGAETIAFFTTPTPGSPNPAPFVPGGTQIVLSEILANNVSIKELDGSTPDWIELYNPATTNVDLADMSLSDTAANARRFVFPAGSIIASHGYYVVRCDADLPISSTNTAFGIKSESGSVYLFDKLSNGGSLIGSVLYGIQAPDFSIGVTVGGTNWLLMNPTPRSANNIAALGNPFLLKVNEWMPNPASGEDWFEIYNPNSQPVALGGLNLTDDTTSPKKSPIPPLSFIASGLYGFQRFWADSNVPAGADHTNFKLNNGAAGETISITAQDGATIDSIAYTSPPLGISRGRLPDGSATIVDFPASPTPGESNFLPLNNVVINEALTHTDLPYEDAIELANLTASPVNIGGWYLSDAKHALKKFRIPDGTTIAANGFIVFYENQFNAVPGSATSFSLNSAKGDDIYLSAATGVGTLTGFRSQVSFGAAENPVSFGRFVTSVGTEFVAMSRLTFGADSPDNVIQFRSGTGLSNAYPKVGPIVISEIMYHPADIGTNDNQLDEFIELHNIGNNDVPLFHQSFPSNTWRLRDAVSFDFPTNIIMHSGDYLLVVSFDPIASPGSLAAFRSHYNLSASVPIVGPYSGKLDNGSDKVELYKPDAPQTPPDPDAGFVPYILVERVHYSDTAPWPTAADGTGSSLQRVTESSFGNDPVNWIAAAPTPGPSASNLDTDGDGMPDAWETAHGLNPNNPADANTDLDGDGATNLQEYLAGTDPQSAQSVLKLTIVGTNPTRLRFVAFPNKGYMIQRRDSLDASTPWTNWLPFSPDTATTTNTVTDAQPLGARFYQIRQQ